MKRLLSYIGSMSLLTTPVASMVGCVNPSMKKSMIEHYQTSLAALDSQIAKMAYVSDHEKYDFDYLMYHFAQPMYLKDLPIQPDDREHLDKYNRYAELFNRYYGDSYLKTNLKTNLILTNTFKPASENKTIATIADLGSQVFKIIKSEGLPALLTLIINGDLLNEFLSPAILKFANDIFDQETLQSFRNAFDDSIYQNMTYQEALTSGIIGLVNATNELTGQQERFNYQDKTKLQASSENYKTALNMFGTTVVKMMNEEIKFKFNLINNLTAISEIIRFGRLVLNYVQQFDATKSPTWNDIVTIRTKPYQGDSKLDLKALLHNLSNWLGDEKGEGLRSLIAILFQSSEHHQIAPSLWNNFSFLTTEDLEPAGLSALGKVVINIYLPLDLKIVKGYMGNLVWDLINTMAAKDTLEDMVSFLNNTFVKNNIPDNIKPIIAKITSNSEAIKDLFVELYQGNILGDILSMVLPNSSFVNIKNLKMVITEPIKQWLPNNEWTNFISDKSIVKVIKETEQAITKPAVIRAEDVYHLFDSFLTPTANDSWLLRDALLNSDHWLETLGFKNNIIIENSPLFYFEKILNNMTGIDGVFTTLTKYLGAFDKSQQKVFQKMQENVAKVSITFLSQPENNVFEYQINDKIMTIVVESNYNKYLINEITIQ